METRQAEKRHRRASVQRAAAARAQQPPAAPANMAGGASDANAGDAAAGSDAADGRLTHNLRSGRTVALDPPATATHLVATLVREGLPGIVACCYKLLVPLVAPLDSQRHGIGMKLTVGSNASGSGGSHGRAALWRAAATACINSSGLPGQLKVECSWPLAELVQEHLLAEGAVHAALAEPGCPWCYGCWGHRSACSATASCTPACRTPSHRPCLRLPPTEHRVQHRCAEAQQALTSNSRMSAQLAAASVTLLTAHCSLLIAAACSCQLPVATGSAP